MRISEIVWTGADVEHIARHGNTPEEVEEVVASGPLWRRGRRHRETGRISVYALGRTESAILVHRSLPAQIRSCPVRHRERDGHENEAFL